MGLSNNLSCEAGSLSCCRPNPQGRFQSGLRLYFPRAGTLGYAVCFAPRSPLFLQFICGRMWCRGVLPAALPAPLSATLSPALWVYLCKCGATGSASAGTACAICPTLRQSRSRHSHASPLPPGARLCPSDPSGYFLFPWCWSPLLFDSLSVLVVRGGAVCLPTPPSWFRNVQT